MPASNTKFVASHLREKITAGAPANGREKLTRSRDHSKLKLKLSKLLRSGLGLKPMPSPKFEESGSAMYPPKSARGGGGKHSWGRLEQPSQRHWGKRKPPGPAQYTRGQARGPGDKQMQVSSDIAGIVHRSRRIFDASKKAHGPHGCLRVRRHVPSSEMP